MKTKLCRTKQNNHCLKSNWEQKDRTETIAKEYILKMEVEKMIQRRGKGNLIFL